MITRIQCACAFAESVESKEFYGIHKGRFARAARLTPHGCSQDDEAVRCLPNLVLGIQGIGMGNSIIDSASLIRKNTVTGNVLVATPMGMGKSSSQTMLKK
jgi:hypothetical protein